MADLVKIRNLIVRVDHLSQQLNATRSLVIHRDINQFYYMQKSEELRLLCDQLQVVLEKKAALEDLLDVIYPEVAMRWKTDARTMHRENIRPRKIIL